MCYSLHKMLIRCYIIFGSTLLVSKATSETLTANNVGMLLLAYENYINASLSLDKSDRMLQSTWMSDFQVKQVNITLHYRLDMTRHQEHSLRGKKTNPKWKDCISLHQKEINRCKSSYLDSESECLKIANSADTGKVQAVRQVEKEIRKWRKSYRYLSNTCNSNFPDDQDAASLCLVEYIKRDNYDVVFQRLIILKLEAMENLLLQLNRALWDLEECLKNCLSNFLNSFRLTMDTLNTCYNITNAEEE